jgi:hypothetical protein
MMVSPSFAQNRSRQRAPVVRVYSQEGAGVASNYVTPAIAVSEDAYMFAVMMDVDGRIQVLHPEYPGISVRLRSQQQLRLPNFFAGFNEPRQNASYSTPNGLVTYDRYEPLGNDTRGTVIALASRTPFNLELIEVGGDWNISEIRRLIEHQSPSSAAQSLAQYLGSNGEPIGRDFMRFAGERRSYYAYDDGYCASGFGYGYGSVGGAYYPSQTATRSLDQRSRGRRPSIVGYDACGVPVYMARPFTWSDGFPVPPGRDPHGTTVFPKARFPHGIARHPIDGDITPRPVPQGIFPLPRRAEPEVRDAPMPAPQGRYAEPAARDVAIPAPQGRRAEPREIMEPYRLPSVNSSPAERPRMPERSAPRADPTPIGSFPVYRQEPRVIAAPVERAREPEKYREAAPAPSPTPIVRERPPVYSSPPPPRVHEAAPSPPPPPPSSSKGNSAAVPPPSR